jgi:hypothetical protein
MVQRSTQAGERRLWEVGGPTVELAQAFCAGQRRDKYHAQNERKTVDLSPPVPRIGNLPQHSQETCDVTALDVERDGEHAGARLA